MSWWRLSGGRCFHQASRFHTKLVPADPVWSPAHATLDNQKGNTLEPFPLSYCVCIRFLLTLSLIFRGGLLCYLNKTHGTCVCFFFFATGIRTVSTHRLPFLAPRDAFSGSAGRSEVPSLLQGWSIQGWCSSFLLKSYGEPHPDRFSFSSGLKKKERKKKNPVSTPLHSLHNENHCDLYIHIYIYTPWEDFTAV